VNQGTSTQALAGWDPTKWADPNHNTPKYQIGRILAGFAPTTANMDAVVAALQAVMPGVTRTGPGNIFVPGFGDTDILQSANAGGTAWQWIDPNDPTGQIAAGGGAAQAMQPDPNALGAIAGAGAQTTAAAAGGGQPDPNSADPFTAFGGGVFVPGVGWVMQNHPAAQAHLANGGTIGPPGATTPASVSNPFSNTTPTAGAGGGPNQGTGIPLTPANSGNLPADPNSIQNFANQNIAALLNTPQTVDPTTLSRSPEARAFNLQAQRGEERQRAQLAERASVDGTSDSGGFETGLAGLRQQRGEGEANFLGNLAVAQMERNAQQLQQGIAFAQSQGQFDQAQRLQMQLAQLQAAIQREQIAMQGTLGQGGLNIQQQALNSQNDQFGKSLGFSYANLNQSANQAAVQALLQGWG
jgi:hypothetical protein